MAKARTPISSAGNSLARADGDDRVARGGSAGAYLEGLIRRLPRTPWRTRFAPAPTGALHLGHLVNAMHVWGIARAFGGSVVLRIEDHDRQRCQPAFERELLDDLEWLGFDADVAPIQSYRDAATRHPFRQSDNAPRYASRLQHLSEQGLVFACDCSRRMIAAAIAREDEGETRYPGTCRLRGVDPRAVHGRRVRMNPGLETFHDLRLGALAQDPAAQCGDVLIRDRHGCWTYQFAVTVDDMAQDIDVIIRGEDLLASTARQQRIARLLGRQSMPLVLHHPLLRHADGAKLSKARRDTSLRERREDGARPEQLLGEAAFLVGLQSSAASLSAADVPALFARAL